MKTCNKCGVEKSLNEYGPSARSRGGKCQLCRACKALYAGVYRRANKKKVAAATKVWLEVNREKAYATNKAYREKNSEKIRLMQKTFRARNPEKVRASQKAWKAANPEKHREFQDRHRARKLNQLGNMPSDGYKVIYKLFGRACLKCKTTENMTIDHVIPLAMGGLHDINNLQPLCRSCNSSKGKKTVDYREEFR